MAGAPERSSSERSTPTVAMESVNAHAVEAQGLREQSHDLGVGGGTLLADALDADLGELERADARASSAASRNTRCV